MTVTGIITAIVIGAIIGALGRLVVPGRQPIPIWLTIVIGIVAAFIGTFLAQAIGVSTATPGIDWGELLVQVIVAALGVFLVAGMYSRRGCHPPVTRARSTGTTRRARPGRARRVPFRATDLVRSIGDPPMPSSPRPSTPHPSTPTSKRPPPASASTPTAPRS